MDWRALTAWLAEFWPQILGALASILLTAFLSAYLSGHFVPLFQERRRAKRDHFKTIQARVIRPLREELEQFYLPLLQGQLGPVTVQPVPMHVEGSVTQTQVVTQYRLGPCRKWTDDPLPFLFRSEVRAPAEIDLELYEDVKRRHFRKPIRRLEAFKVQAEAHAARWVEHATHLSRLIANRLGLPPIHWESLYTDPEWIHADGLAVFLLNWQLGHNWQTIVGPEGRSLEAGGRMLVKATKKETIDYVIEVLNELSRDKQAVEELRRGAEPLIQRATALVREFKQLEFSSRLPGRCRLAKV